MNERPLFLERRSYRARRLMDVVRVLPLVCAVLWLVIPLLWPQADDAGAAGTPMSQALRYVFAIWLLAIAGCFALWRRTRRTGQAAD